MNLKKAIWVLAAVLIASASAHAVGGPSGGTYVYGLQQQVIDSDYPVGDDNTAWGDPTLYSWKFDSNWDFVASSDQTFTPIIPGGYGGHKTNHSSGFKPGAYTIVPTVYERTTGHAKLLLGTYADNDPAANTAGKETMDVLLLEPQNDSTLTQTNVYAGKGYVASTFHTEDATQVLYDAEGNFTGTAKSLAVVGTWTGATSRMSGRGVGWVTDADGDGEFDDVGSTETYMALNAEFRTPPVMGKQGIYSAASRYFPFGQASGYTGINGSIRLDNGSIINVPFYIDCTTINGGLYTYPVVGHPINRSADPDLAVADTTGDGRDDVYFSTSWDHDSNGGTADAYAFGRATDLNGDGDAFDDNEVNIVFTFGAGSGFYTNDTAYSPIGLVESDNGDWSLLFHGRAHNAGGTNYEYYAAVIGLADNGDWDGAPGKIISATKNVPAGALDGMGWISYNSLISVSTTTEIPEPGTMLLLGTGILGAIGFIRRRRMK